MDRAEEKRIRLITGLGNPGREYENTRHNIGFISIDRLLAGLGPRKWVKIEKFSSLFWTGKYRGAHLLLHQPLTYMNVSGQAVAALMAAYAVQPEELLLIYDDMDLPVGRIRLRQGGGDSGHKGVESILAALNTDRFARLRIGIGKSGENNGRDYVLDPFTEEERVIIDLVLATVLTAVKTLLHRGLNQAMNDFNGMMRQKQST